jgi:hypothetical protein
MALKVGPKKDRKLLRVDRLQKKRERYDGKISSRGRF